MVMVDGHCRGKFPVSRQNKDTFQIATVLTKIKFLCNSTYILGIKIRKSKMDLNIISLSTAKSD